VYRAGLAKLLATYIGQELTVLVTGRSKRSEDDLQGKKFMVFRYGCSYGVAVRSDSGPVNWLCLQ